MVIAADKQIIFGFIQLYIFLRSSRAGCPDTWIIEFSSDKTLISFLEKSLKILNNLFSFPGIIRDEKITLSSFSS